jgi:hypothetical protein
MFGTQIRSLMAKDKGSMHPDVLYTAVIFFLNPEINKTHTYTESFYVGGGECTVSAQGFKNATCSLCWNRGRRPQRSAFIL